MTQKARKRIALSQLARRASETIQEVRFTRHPVIVTRFEKPIAEIRPMPQRKERRDS